MNRKRVEIDLLMINILIGIFLAIVFTDSLSWLRVILGIPLIILFPGYVFIGVLYPRKDSISHVNRIALSLGLSIVVIVLIGLVLNYLPWGIGLYSITISISILISLLSAITWYIRGRYHPEERYGFTIKLPSGNLIDYSRSLNRVHLSLIILIICSIIGFAVFLSYTLAKPPEREPFTEFYILGIENRADSYPLELKLGERGEVTVGIVSREYEAINYRIEVVVEDNKTYELFPIVLAPEEKWHGELEFTPEPVVKRQKVEFRLYKDAGWSGEVRYLWVNVKA
ncbi:MAG: DUF1616 domain-containing protein [Chloroflexi bacterium]|nr:DUF1616 domain-containing protein [Chloroflexota bacterium]